MNGDELNLREISGRKKAVSSQLQNKLPSLAAQKNG